MRENIIAGLVSGIFVAIFAFAFRSFWNSIIVPWFEERVYKDVRIEGKWYSFWPEENNKRQEVVSLKRHGHQVSGTIICSNGPDKGEEYNVSGSFRNMILPLTYESTDKKKTDRGSITLIAKHNGEKLSGKIAAYHTGKDTIVTTQIIWFRNQDHLCQLLEHLKSKDAEIKRINKEREKIEHDAKKIETIEPNEENCADKNKRNG